MSCRAKGPESCVCCPCGRKRLLLSVFERSHLYRSSPRRITRIRLFLEADALALIQLIEPVTGYGRPVEEEVVATV